jgi:hypothetical protein
LSLGVCNETSNATFICLCESGWEGIQCKTLINYCQTATCMNNGVCRPSFMNYTCECLGDSYSGLHCEIVSTKTATYKTVSKSLAYVAIIAMTAVAMFIIAMDVLKYCFGIDVTYTELQQIRRKFKIKPEKYKPVIIRFTYVDAPAPASPSNNQNSIIHETTV